MLVGTLSDIAISSLDDKDRVALKRSLIRHIPPFDSAVWTAENATPLVGCKDDVKESATVLFLDIVGEVFL